MFNIGDIVEALIDNPAGSATVKGDIVKVTKQYCGKYGTFFEYEYPTHPHKWFYGEVEDFRLAVSVPLNARIPFKKGDLVETLVDFPGGSSLKIGEVAEVTTDEDSQGYFSFTNSRIMYVCLGTATEFKPATIGLVAGLNGSTVSPSVQLPSTSGTTYQFATPEEEEMLLKAGSALKKELTGCECGSDKVGSPRHSNWCVKYNKES